MPPAYAASGLVMSLGSDPPALQVFYTLSFTAIAGIFLFFYIKILDKFHKSYKIYSVAVYMFIGRC